MTKTEKLAAVYHDPKSTPDQRQEAFNGLVYICIRACGPLFPPHKPEQGACYSSLNYGIKGRRYQWVASFVRGDIYKDPRYIGKRCRNALADVVRSQYRIPRQPRRYGPSTAQVLVWSATALPALVRHRESFQLLQLLTWVYPGQLNELTNTNMASCADRDEKVIRRRKQRLARLLVNGADLAHLPLLRALKLHKHINLKKVQSAVGSAAKAEKQLLADERKQSQAIENGWDTLVAALEDWQIKAIPSRVRRLTPSQRRQ